MSELFQERRHVDQQLQDENEKLAAQAKETNRKLDALTGLINTINTNVLVFIAESKGAAHGVGERLQRLEDWQSATTKYLIGIVIMIGMALFYAISSGAGIRLK